MASTPGQWSGIGQPTSPVQSTPEPILPAPQIEFATPPTEEAVDSEGNALRYRTLQDLHDNTDVIHGFEYSGVCCLAGEEPKSVDEALSEQCWRTAMKTEMESIQSKRTWELAVLPAGHRAIGLKWVYKVKKDPEGKILKYKARLVAERKDMPSVRGWTLRKCLL